MAIYPNLSEEVIQKVFEEWRAKREFEEKVLIIMNGEEFWVTESEYKNMFKEKRNGKSN